MLLTLYRFDGPGTVPPSPLLVADYDDLYRHCRDDGWRFAERRLTIVFAA